MAYTDDFVIGKNAKLYYDSAANYGTPTWVLIPRVGDLSVNFGKNQGSSRTREVPVEVFGGGVRTASLSFQYTDKKGSDTIGDALEDSYLNDTKIEFLVLDGDNATSGNKGYRFIGIVNQWNQSQAMEDPLTRDVEVVPSSVDDSGTIRTISAYTVP